MARQTFFSFHYNLDNTRAGVVRNSSITKGKGQKGFFDSAEWEKVKKKEDSAIEKWIDDQLVGTSATAVLIGEKTYGRKWINYEITSSWNKGNALLGIYIHGIKNLNSQTANKGLNPFSQWTFKNKEGNVVSIPVYNWVSDNGYENLGDWIENAPKR